MTTAPARRRPARKRRPAAGPPVNNMPFSTCAAFSTCGSCAAATGCHWCSASSGGGGACHAYGSVYGCAIGQSCFIADGCLRSRPETVPARAATAGEVVGVLLLCLFVAAAALCCVNVSAAFRSSTASTEESRDERYVSLSSMEENAEGEVRALAATRKEQEEARLFIPTVKRTTSPACVRAVHGCARVGCGLVVVASMVLGAIAIAAYPHNVAYSICDTSLDYTSLLNSLAHLTLAADYMVAASVENPNRFDLEVDRVAATFAFQGETVATLAVDQTTMLTATSVIDRVLPIRVAPGVATAYAMERALQEGNLVLNVNAKIEGRALGWGLGWTLDYDVKDHAVNLSAASDERLCAPCTET